MEIDKEYLCVDDMYKSPFSSYWGFVYNNKQLHIFKTDGNKDIYFYSIRDKAIYIHNSLINYSESSLKDFCDYCFKEYDIRYVKTALSLNRIDLPYSFVSYTLDDYILDLPENNELYLSSLGKQTKKHLLYYYRRAEREINDFHIEIKHNNDITYDDISNIVRLNNDRRKQKGSDSFPDEETVLNEYHLLNKYGVIFQVFGNNKLLGASAICVFDDLAYLPLIGSDYEYDKYNIGNIALYESIKYSIDNKCTKYHFFWGYMDYKTRFGGKKCDLYEYRIYNPHNIFNYYKDKPRFAIKAKIDAYKNSIEFYELKNKIKKLLTNKS